MADVRQTNAAVKSSHAQDGAGTSSGSSNGLAGVIAETSSGTTGVVASVKKPVGVVAPQKRVAVANNTATSASRANGTQLIVRYVTSNPAGVQAPQPPNPVQPQQAGPSAAQGAAQPTQPRNDAQAPGNRVVPLGPALCKILQQIRQECVLFLHAHNCQPRENQANGEQWQPCTFSNCSAMKNAINHMRCKAGKQCKVPHCCRLHLIFDHWRRCGRKTNCQVCMTIQQAGNDWYTNSNVPPGAANYHRRQNKTAGSAAANEVASNIIPLPVIARMQLVLPNIEAPTQRNKEWHQSVTPQHRNHIVLNMVKSIYPHHDPQASILDRRILNLVTMCTRVENNFFEEANSMSGYYHLIARKIHKMQKELVEKRQQHAQQRQQMQGQQQNRAALARVNPIAPLHLKRSKPLLKSTRAMLKPIGTVRPTLRMFIRVHSSGMRVLQNRTGARQSSNSQTTSNLPRLSAQIQADSTAARAPATTEPACNGTVAPVAVPQGEILLASAEPRPNSFESEPLAGNSTSNTPPVQPVAPDRQVNALDERKISIERCIQSLMHACQCKDANCRLPSCQRMKRVVQHIKTCKRRTSGGCPICKQLVALCCYHARHCQEAKCPVTFCFNTKQKLKQQQHHQRLQKAQDRVCHRHVY